MATNYQTIIIFHLIVPNSNLRELFKLPHGRQLQESSLALSRGGPAGCQLGAGAIFVAAIYNEFSQ